MLAKVQGGLPCMVRGAQICEENSTLRVKRGTETPWYEPSVVFGRGCQA